MAVYADDYLGVYVPNNLMERVDYHSDGGHGYICGSIFAMRHEETADYIMNNRESQLAQNFVDEYGIDLNNRAEVIKHIDHLNVLMGENI
jgi:hypothetical protein